MTMKQTLRGLIEASREREREEFVAHIDEPPGEPDAWSAKDELSHLSAWRSIASEEIDAARTGGPVPLVLDEVDEQNAKIYQATHDLTPEAVLEESNRSWEALLAAVDACSDEDLHGPRPRRPEQEIWQVVAVNTYLHLGQHIDWWRSRRGEDADAEAAAKWAYELAVDSFPEGSRRGIAEYNLGCYYASHGRADEALPYLERGIELYPPLIEIARQDSDLDPIRSVPELEKLLA
jgi:tetratricopeptide (TPR) repeat protein